MIATYDYKIPYVPKELARGLKLNGNLILWKGTTLVHFPHGKLTHLLLGLPRFGRTRPLLKVGERLGTSPKGYWSAPTKESYSGPASGFLLRLGRTTTLPLFDPRSL